jgi:hypothetical protein
MKVHFNLWREPETFYTSTITTVSPACKMAKGANKAATKTKKNRGRQSDFSGEKEEYLNGLAKDFHIRKDRGAFYNEAAQGLIDRFGYSRDGRVYVDGDMLSTEEKLEYYQALRNVSIHFRYHIILEDLLRGLIENGPMVSTPKLGKVLRPNIRCRDRRLHQVCCVTPAQKAKCR